MTPFLSNILEQKGWEGLFQFAKKQSLVGVIWDNIQDSMDLYGGIPKQILKQWVTMVGKIEERNKLTDEVAMRTSERFAKDRFDSIILKGQGLCHYYPTPLHRQPGDVDIWIWPEDTNYTLTQRQDTIVSYIRNIKPDARICYHHIEFKKIQDTEVEVHFTPSWMYTPRKNKILQEYFQEVINRQSSAFHKVQVQAAWNNQLPIPTDDFNLIFILIHIFRHVFDEGIGLRQMMDYDMVLRHSSSHDRVSAICMLELLRLTKFTRAVMYVLHEVFGTDESVLLCSPDTKEGKWLLKLIMEGGNFGLHKKLEKYKRNDGHSTHLNNFINRIRRSSQLVFHYPEEAFWTIPWRIWHWHWRLRKGYL